MSRSYPERRRIPSADEAREQGVGAMRGLGICLFLIALGGLGIGLLWCAGHPHSVWSHALAAVLVTVGLILVIFLTLAPVAARQAGGRR
jgi:membrane protein YdbS with pleckstrin-like domain